MKMSYFIRILKYYIMCNILRWLQTIYEHYSDHNVIQNNKIKCYIKILKDKLLVEAIAKVWK